MAVLLKLIKTLNESLHMTSILVSHDVKETASISDYIYIISNGKMISHGTPRQISRTKDDNVVQFMKGLADGPEQFHYPAGDYCEELFQTVKGNNDS